MRLPINRILILDKWNTGVIVGKPLWTKEPSRHIMNKKFKIVCSNYVLNT